MGYACPVCEEPQADGVHLANHLAFTALTGGADHEDWLDDHVPDWGGMGESTLADAVVDLADEAAFPLADVDEHVHGEGRGPDHRDGEGRGPDHRDGGLPHAAGSTGGSGARGGPLDDETRAVVEQARELTRKMRAGDADGSDHGGHSADGDEVSDASGDGDEASDAATGDETE